MNILTDKLGVDADTYTHRDTGNDNTLRPKLASGKNMELFTASELIKGIVW